MGALKFIVIGGAAALGVYIIANKLSPQPTTLGGNVGKVVAPALAGSIIDPSSWSAMAASDGAANVRPPTGGLLGDSQIDNYATHTGDGDSAMADGLGRDQVNSSNPQPAYFVRFSDRAIAGSTTMKSPFANRTASAKS